MKFRFQPLIIKGQVLARAHFSCHFTSDLSSHTGGAYCTVEEAEIPRCQQPHRLDCSLQPRDVLFGWCGAVLTFSTLDGIEYAQLLRFVSTYTCNLQHSGRCTKPLTKAPFRLNKVLQWRRKFSSFF